MFILIKMNKNKIQIIALERINRLNELIEKETDEELIERWKELMKKISTRNKVKIPKEIKQKLFKKT